MSLTEVEEDRRGALLDCQRRILERIATGAPLVESLGTLVKLIEEQTPDMRCAVLLADERGEALRFVAAPNIPQDYKQGIEPFLRIAPDMGSCGTAAYLRAPDYTEDTATDPRWEGCRHFAVRNGLRAIWSTPILGDDNSVLGTFAMYYGEPRLPVAEHIRLIDMAVQMARVAIQGKRDEERLRASEEKYRLMADHARDLILLVDASGRRLYNSPSYRSLYGDQAQALVGKNALDSVHAEDRQRVEREFRDMIRTGVGRRFEFRVTTNTGEVRVLQSEGTPIKDSSGQVISVLGVGRDITQERTTQEALRESEQLLRTIVEHAPAGVAIADLDHRLIRANPTFARLVGYSEAELQGMPVDAFTHEEDRLKNAALFRELFDGKAGPLALDKRYRRKDGRIVWVRVTVSLVRGPQGEPRYTVALVEDVSDRKQKEDHLRLVINTIPTMAWSLLPDGRIDFINQRWLEYAGLSLEQALAEPTRAMHPADLPVVMEEWSAAMAAGQAYEGEMRLRRADGEYRWFLVRTVPLRDEQGSIVKWYGASIDIEARKRAEEAARRREMELRDVIETIPAIAWTGRPDGSNEFTNRSWREYTGLTVEETAETGWQSAIHPEDIGVHVEKWLASVASGEPFENEARYRRGADGEYRWFLVRGVPLRDEHGNIVRWYGILADIEDRKRAEEALRLSADRLQRLSRRLLEVQEGERRRLARELHDRLGETLTALGINLSMLKVGVQGDARAVARIEDSTTLVKSTAAAIEDIVAELRPPMFDDHGLAAALDWYGRQFSARSGIAVTVQANEPNARVAPEVGIALFRIAQEALNNVAKHAQAKRVVVTLWRAGSEFVMSISDDGIGLPPTEIQSQRRATGLGMVTMRERAQAVGGRFEIERLPEQGTRLTVRVPL